MPGLIPELIPPDTGFLGGVAPDLADILPSGDWEPYLPSLELQQKYKLETMGCVSFSRLNCSETQANFYGKPINFSDRALAWVSGTTKKGNTYSNVDYAFRTHGTCLEPVWPWNMEMDWDTYYQTPPSDVQSEMKKILSEWDIGMRTYVPITVESLKEALKKGPLWACTNDHSFEIYRVDDKIHIFDTYQLEGDGKRHWPLSDISRLVSAYIVPFTPKALVPPPMIKLPPNSLVVVVDGHGERLMNVDSTKLYQDDPGKILTEIMARNAKEVNGVMMCGTFPEIHVKTEDIKDLPRVNLKGQPV